MTIYEQIRAKNIPFNNHESDLYVKVTPESRVIVKQYKHRQNVTTFFSETDNTMWYDIPFAFDPWWQERGM